MHNHNHLCQYDNIKYCSTCAKPYCVDCGKEWGTPYTWYYNNGYPTYTYTYDPKRAVATLNTVTKAIVADPHTHN